MTKQSPTPISADRAPQSTMRAVVRTEYGPPEVLRLEDVARPVPGSDEVLVRVHAAGIDRGAIHLMTGRPLLMRIAGFGVRRPRNHGLGTELSGVVTAAGADVTAFQVGDEVYGAGVNTFAQYAVASSASLSRKPGSLSHAQAAAVPVSGVTALQAVRRQGRVQPGQAVLVIGASGGVGSFAVQIAKAVGAQVTGVASAAKLDLVRALGADHVIDYRAGELTDHGRRYDVVLDIGGNRPVRTLRRLLNPNGTLVFVGGEDGGSVTGGLGRQVRALLLSPFTRQRFAAFWVALANSADLAELTAMIEDGRVTAALDEQRPLDDVATALQDLEQGTVRGKIVIVP